MLDLSRSDTESSALLRRNLLQVISPCSETMQPAGAPGRAAEDPAFRRDPRPDCSPTSAVDDQSGGMRKFFITHDSDRGAGKNPRRLALVNAISSCWSPRG